MSPARERPPTGGAGAGEERRPAARSAAAAPPRPGREPAPRRPPALDGGTTAAADRPSMSDEEYRLLRGLIYRHSGLVFDEDRRHLLERRLAQRLRANGLRDFAGYHRLLSDDRARDRELESALDVLTTHETYFFREPHQLRAFSQELLPALERERRRERRLRVWSAGCSTGEEVYTIAILLARSGLFEGWDVEVFGSHLAPRVLALARAGAYGPGAFRTPEGEALRSWFRFEDGKWLVPDELRRMARFGALNLLDPRGAPPGQPDVIFCRNVLIYFDHEARERVARTFHDRLRPGGYLLLGHAESLLNATADFELVQLREDLVYRKPCHAA